MITNTYFIDTGAKEDYYTLWRERVIDLRPRDEQGNVVEEKRVFHANGMPMDYFIRTKFIQNLSKTKEGAMEKVKELIGTGKFQNLESLKEDDYDLNLHHNTKPSIEVFGASMKYKNGKWMAKATREFFDAWRENKEEMKKAGWMCWKYKGNPSLRVESAWYMAFKEIEN